MKHVDLSTWSRKNHFELFRHYKDPFFGITVALDLTKFLPRVKQAGQTFFFAFLHAVLEAANDCEALKLRIRGDAVVLHDTVHASYTLMTEEGVFRFQTAVYHKDRGTFLKHASEDAVTAAKTVDVSDKVGVDDLIYVSSIPWIAYTAVRHAMPGNQDDSFPRLTWGKYETHDGITTIPFSVDAHHALVDGHDVAMFVKRLQEVLDRP